MIRVREYIGEKAFYAKAARIALPIMMQGSIYNLIGLLNNIMVGRVSTVQMNGVAVVNQLMFVFYSCISGIFGGIGVFTAQFSGKGSGINVSCFNINYCTENMYRNALVTAGIEDANVVVAGPKPIAGTAALVGVAKAYEQMTGKELPKDSLAVANNELALTGELAKTIGDPQKVEELIALIKQYVAENGLDSDEDIMEVIDKASDKLEITLSDHDKQQLLALMIRSCMFRRRYQNLLLHFYIYHIKQHLKQYNCSCLA